MIIPDPYPQTIHPLQGIIETELRPGERVLWIGKPNAKRLALRCTAVYVFATLWIGVLFASEFMGEWQFGRPWHIPATDIPFILVGGALFLSPLFVFFKEKRMVYALTESRIILIEDGKSKRVESYESVSLDDIRRRERSDESGDLIFAQRRYKDDDGHERTTDVMFASILDVRQVEHLVRSTLGR